MAKKEFAPGLPDPHRFGRITTLPKGTPLSYVIQRHLARKAGPHYDIRFGPNGGTKPTLLSWAARKLPTEPGQKTLAFRQPLHTGQYADFEGEITSGYGKGTVKTHDRGRVIVTKAEPDKINFVVAHKKHPETFTLVRKRGPPTDPKTSRERQTQGGTWLLINTTPTDVIQHKKVHYAKVPAKDVAKLFDKEYLHEEKIDGAAALYKLLSDRIEILSYRPTTTGRPIVHTYRVGGTTGVNIPKHLVGSVLRGELYGVRTSTGHAIPSQELGGLLNASTLKSLTNQRRQRAEIKSTLFNVNRYGKKDVSIETPLEERLKMLREIMAVLPKGKFRLPEMARTPEEQKELWERVSSGKHPLTHEGIVAWPIRGGKPTKVKLYSEHDVHVRKIVPGEKRLAGTAAGGFRYSLTPSGKVVGKVGTGFSEATRKQMWETPEEFVGRIARVEAQEQFPSGAYRAPSFIGRHEDYPAAKAAADQPMPNQARRDIRQHYESMFAPTTLGELGETAGTFGLFGAGIGSAGALGRAGLAPLGLAKAPKVSLGRALVRPWAPKALAGHASEMWGRPGAALGKAVTGKAIPSALVHGTPWGTIIMALMEAMGGLSGAQTNPEYQRGKIGYLRALGRHFAGTGEAAQAKALRAYQGRFGGLKGLVTTPIHGMFNPIATTTAFGQALKRLLAGSSKKTAAVSPKILQPIIKQAIGKLGGNGETMADLVKAATTKPPELPADLAQELGVKAPVSIADQLRAWLIGVKPQEVKNLRRGISGVATTVNKLQSLMAALGVPTTQTSAA